MTSTKQKFIACLLIAVIAVVATIIYQYPVFSTENIIKVEVKRVCRTGEYPESPRMDYWGNKLEYLLALETDKKGDEYLTCSVRSAGRDNEFSTDDDIAKSNININWSKKIGRASGRMFNQAAKGFAQGVVERWIPGGKE